MRQHITRRVAILLATVALALGIPLGVTLASHQFGDVPDSNPFHADVDALVDSGVTFGCGGGNFCPTQSVTREQMAAFMNRLGALGPGQSPKVNADKLDGLTSTDFGVAGGRVAANGTLGQWFNRAGGILSVEHAGAGLYRITVPGRNFNINSNFVGSVTLISSAGFVTINSIGGTRVQVQAYNTAGVATDISFSFVVYDASTSG